MEGRASEDKATVGPADVAQQRLAAVAAERGKAMHAGMTYAVRERCVSGSRDRAGRWGANDDRGVAGDGVSGVACVAVRGVRHGAV
jgi:hypothetical protein